MLGRGVGGGRAEARPTRERNGWEGDVDCGGSEIEPKVIARHKGLLHMPPTYESYILCATPRSGSTLLCDLLDATGVAGAPDSFFMQNPDPIWVEGWGLPPREGKGTAEHSAAYLKAAAAAGRGQTGIFGLRLMRENLEDLMAMVDQLYPGHGSDRAGLQAAFGRVLFIHLSRGDKLSQAISLVKAEQTGLWHMTPDGSELERSAPPRAPSYDFARIKAELDALEAYDAKWQIWFAAQEIEPLRLTYETLSEAPGAAVLAICAALGVPAPSPERLVPGVAKLGDAVSREWATRFRAEAAAQGQA